MLGALEAAGVRVEQIHPEYGPAQFEVSVAAQDPVSAADTCVLVKFVIGAVTARHGLRASFAPAVFADNVGNGGHLHASFARDGHSLFSGGKGRHGLTDTGESIIAGLLDALPALLAIGAPSPASYLRLQPSRWAGVYQVWGAENREAAVRFIEANPLDPGTANVELKCFDLSANPYLLTGAVMAVALASADRHARLPDEVTGDPAAPGHPLGGRAVRLPGSLAGGSCGPGVERRPAQGGWRSAHQHVRDIQAGRDRPGRWSARRGCHGARPVGEYDGGQRQRGRPAAGGSPRPRGSDRRA